MFFIKKYIIKFIESVGGSRVRAQLYRKYYGVKIGNNIRFTGKPVWGSEPFLIEIGNDVTITQDVTFITHDGGVGVLREELKGVNVFGKINIGNNVFIGARTILMPGVTIGNNVVIAAGSIVTKDISNNSVAAGVPARVIKNIDEYKENILSKAVYIYEKDPVKRVKEIIKKLEKEL